MAFETGALRFRPSQEVADIGLRVIQEIERTHRISDIGMSLLGLDGLPISPMAEDASKPLRRMAGQKLAGMGRQGLLFPKRSWIGHPFMAFPALLGATRLPKRRLSPCRQIDRQS